MFLNILSLTIFFTACVCGQDAVPAPYEIAFDLSFEDDSTGTVIFEVHPEWAPIGAKRFADLIEMKFFDGTRFFRVIENFVAQFGMAHNYIVSGGLSTLKIEDDEAEAGKHTNAKYTMTFASAGDSSRTSQVFVNLNDNKHLDELDFTPFAEATSGIEYLDKIYTAHGESPKQRAIQYQGGEYLDENFPELTLINRVYFINGTYPYAKDDGAKADVVVEEEEDKVCSVVDAVDIASGATATPGDPCMFGVHEDDEGSHCMEAEGIPSGWCYTAADQSAWGVCGDSCGADTPSSCLPVQCGMCSECLADCRASNYGECQDCWTADSETGFNCLSVLPNAKDCRSCEVPEDEECHPSDWHCHCRDETIHCPIAEAAFECHFLKVDELSEQCANSINAKVKQVGVDTENFQNMYDDIEKASLRYKLTGGVDPEEDPKGNGCAYGKSCIQCMTNRKCVWNSADSGVGCWDGCRGEHCLYRVSSTKGQSKTKQCAAHSRGDLEPLTKAKIDGVTEIEVSDEELIAASMEWKRIKDDNTGKFYFWNQKTGVTQWSKPDDNQLQKNIMATKGAKVTFDTEVEGDGETFAGVGDTVTVHYTGTLASDGTKFDSSVDRGEPLTFTVGLGQVIKGWDQAIPQLSLGTKAIVHIPSILGYGSMQAGDIPPNSALDFEVEILAVNGVGLEKATTTTALPVEDAEDVEEAGINTKHNCTCADASFAGTNKVFEGCGTAAPEIEEVLQSKGRPWCDTREADCNDGAGWDFCGEGARDDWVLSKPEEVKEVQEPVVQYLAVVKAVASSVELVWMPTYQSLTCVYNTPQTPDYALVYRKVGDSNWQTGPKGLREPHGVIDGLDANTKYEVMVRVESLDGEELPSSEVKTFKTKGGKGKGKGKKGKGKGKGKGKTTV